MKANGESKDRVAAEVVVLSKLKKELADIEKQIELTRPLYTRCREQLENLVKRRSIYFPAFDIYGGVAGLYDWGPTGCALKVEVESLWRRHFILREEMLEISGTCLTPHTVLKISGHVDRFCDLICEDTVTGDQYRADKLLEDWIDTKIQTVSAEEGNKLDMIRRQADGYSSHEMREVFNQLGVTTPLGNSITDPIPFNLMFKSRIGPKEVDSHDSTAYLRPETAQGIFVNFRRLLEYNAGKLPFAAAQVGLGFRNEIAPRNGLLRVREFLMGEIEHFVHPDEKNHPSFTSVTHICLPLYSRENQLGSGLVRTDLPLGEAVSRKIVNNETLAYYMARTWLFLLQCGIQEQGIRFRQHLTTEMAHYASDCWDAEVETSYGWVECVGHADRAAFDLDAHAAASKVPLVASRRLPEKKTIECLETVPNKGLLGPAFKKRNQEVQLCLETLLKEDKIRMQNELESTGATSLLLPSDNLKVNLNKEMLQFKKVIKQISEESFTPHVIEPSFGIGRIIYCLLEHCFRSRGIVDQEERCFFAFPPVIAPIKVSILPISSDDRFNKPVSELKKLIIEKEQLSCKVDVSSASIGKRYARTDELGIPFAITADFDTLKDSSVTVRERDSMEQIRIGSFSEAAGVVSRLIKGEVSWKSVQESYPKFSSS